MSDCLTNAEVDQLIEIAQSGFGGLDQGNAMAVLHQLMSLRAAWKIAEPHLPQDVYRRALAALDASR